MEEVQKPHSPLSIAVITRDRTQILGRTISHHSGLCGPHQIPLYVYDNGVRESAEEVCKKFPNVRYHKHDKDLTYDESFRYALTHTPGDYVWVLSDREVIGVGGELMIIDWLIRMKFAAVVVGFGGRLALLNGPYIEKDKSTLFRTVGWHTTLCGSTIYSRELIEKAEYDRYMGKGFVHTAALFDGLSKVPGDVLVMQHALLASDDDLWPKWLSRHVEIWCKNFLDTLEALPDCYSHQDKERVAQHNGFNGALLRAANFQFLAAMGAFDRETLDKYWKYIRRITYLSYRQLRKIADGAWRGENDD